MDGLTLTGEVLKVETLRGNKNGKDWVIILVHVLADVNVYETQIGREWKGPIPERGDRGSFRVNARAFLRGGAVSLGFDLLEKLEDVPSGAARAVASVG